MSPNRMKQGAQSTTSQQFCWVGILDLPLKEEIVEESKLEADEGTVDAELPEYHPCDVGSQNLAVHFCVCVCVCVVSLPRRLFNHAGCGESGGTWKLAADR